MFLKKHDIVSRETHGDMDFSQSTKKKILETAIFEAERLILQTQEQVDGLMKHASEAPGAMQSVSDWDKQHYSKLADEQRNILGQLRAGLRLLEEMRSDGESPERISLGALVKTSNERLYFISPMALRKLAVADGEEVLVITAQSPIGEVLMDRKAGDEVRFGGRSFVVERVG